MASLVVMGQRDAEKTETPARNFQQWGALTSFHGLPSDRVRAIAQDRDGVLWFATDSGLARYDGRRIQTVISAGLPAGRVLALTVDAEGSLWVGTESGAARMYSGEFQIVKEAEGNSISAIAISNGRVALASLQGFIFECQKSSEGGMSVNVLSEPRLAKSEKTRKEPAEITSVVFRGDELLAGTRGRGLLSFSGDQAHEIESHPRPFFVESLAIDAGGRVWVGTKTGARESGLFVASDVTRLARTELASGPITALAADERGDVWAATEGQGVFRISESLARDHFTFEDTAGGLRSNTIYSTFIDREGVVWFGTDRGISRYDPQSPHNEDVSSAPDSNFVRSLFETRAGDILCGTNRGLFVQDRKKKEWKAVAGLEHSTIYSMAEDASGQLMVGSATGLYRNVGAGPAATVDYTISPSAPRGENNRGEQPSEELGPNADEVQERAVESVRAIQSFQGKTYVAVYGVGVEQLDGEGRSRIWPDPASDPRLRQVTTLHSDDSSGLWIGTAESGAFLLKNGTVGAVPGLDSLKGTAVWALDGSRANVLWFATGRGLYAFSEGKLREVVTNLDVRGVSADRPLQDGGTAVSAGAWAVALGAGLLRVVLNDKLGPLVSRLDVEQGLSSPNAFSILRLNSPNSSESLLIGTARGVVRYEPGHSSPSLVPARILSRRVHEASELASGISLEYPQNSLLFEATAISSRTFPEQFQYSFLLRSDDGSIIRQKLSHDPQFLMNNLAAGKYSVEARAFSRDLVPSAPLSFQFIVAHAPFPWTSTALSILLGLALVALVWAIVEHQRITRASRELASINQELAAARLDLANEAERERRRIARDLHDQTLGDLRRLLMLTDKLPAGARANGNPRQLDPAEFRGEVEAISQEIRLICEDLSPSVLENIGLTAALEWALTNAVTHAQGQDIRWNFSCDEGLEELEFAQGVRIQIYRIAQEVINNIIRHAQPTYIGIKTSLSVDGEFVLEVEDNGKGFEPAAANEKPGRGLANIKARANLIEAGVSWSQSEGGRNLFRLWKFLEQHT